MHVNGKLATKIGSDLIKVDFFDRRILERRPQSNPLVKPKSPDSSQPKSSNESPRIRLANIIDSTSNFSDDCLNLANTEVINDFKGLQD